MFFHHFDVASPTPCQAWALPSSLVGSPILVIMFQHSALPHVFLGTLARLLGSCEHPTVCTALFSSHVPCTCTYSKSVVRRMHCIDFFCRAFSDVPIGVPFQCFPAFVLFFGCNFSRAENPYSFHGPVTRITLFLISVLCPVPVHFTFHGAISQFSWRPHSTVILAVWLKVLT